MKKLFTLMWFAIVLLTAVCFVLIYSDKNESNNKSNVQSSSSQPQPTYNKLSEKPTLPTVEPIIRPSREAGTKDARGTDFEEPSGSGTRISSSEAAGQYGEQGSEKDFINEYIFPEEMYPYRAMLTVEQQNAYDRIYASAMMCVDNCRIYEMVSIEGIHDIMLSIYNDHPELFWLDKKYSYKYAESGKVISVKMNFNETVNDLNNALNLFNAEVNDIVEAASQFEDDEEKEKYVYETIIDRVEYVSSSQLNQSAYSALVNKESVCAGYSRAFQYIMQKLDIPCYFCSGYSKGGNHAWNIIKINGEYYNVDISWDDSLGAKDDKTYRYYNIKDDKFAVQHTRRDLSILLPKCE